MASRIRGYGLAVVATSSACLVDVLFLPTRFSEITGALYVIAALVSTWFGGLGPGLTAVALMAAFNLVFFNYPKYSLSVGVYGVSRLILFAVVALLVSWLTSRVRRNQQELSRLNTELTDKVKKLNESNEQLEAFCYTLAHDLRAPLRAIQGIADMVIMDKGAELDCDGTTGLERIRNSAERMGRLILDLLAYTDLTRSDARRQPVDLEISCRAVRRIFADEIAGKKADVTDELRARFVLGDPAGIERVLFNLLGNALKFAHPDRPPGIHIVSERKGANVRVCVEDNGVGLDPKYRERIFGVFERLDPTGSPMGTGIGLAIVKRSVEKMGGRVGVESTPGEGSCFWFELAEAAGTNGEGKMREEAQRPSIESSDHWFAE